jgi:hypothetical protein
MPKHRTLARDPDGWGINWPPVGSFSWPRSSRAGHTNYDIWQSKGPVFIGRGFTQFWTDYCDTIALCWVLLKIGWPELTLPGAPRPLFEWADERWGGIGKAVASEFFRDMTTHHGPIHARTDEIKRSRGCCWFVRAAEIGPPSFDGPGRRSIVGTPLGLRPRSSCSSRAGG